MLCQSENWKMWSNIYKNEKMGESYYEWKIQNMGEQPRNIPADIM